jgi:hypothetical protein
MKYYIVLNKTAFDKEFECLAHIFNRKDLAEKLLNQLEKNHDNKFEMIESELDI